MTIDCSLTHLKFTLIISIFFSPERISLPIKFIVIKILIFIKVEKELTAYTFYYILHGGLSIIAGFKYGRLLKVIFTNLLVI